MRKIPITFHCDVNNRSFTIDGAIDLSDGGGFTVATPKFEREKMPHAFQPELLSYVAITGYPSESYAVGSATNPFADAKANFRTIRDLDLGERGYLHTDYYSEHRGTEHERLVFHASGKTTVEQRIIAISPVAEVWRPSNEPNVFFGDMTFTWKLEDGSSISAHAKTRYEIKSHTPLTSEQLRIITFDLDTGATFFKQSEIIRLYDMLEWSTALPRLLNEKKD